MDICGPPGEMEGVREELDTNSREILAEAESLSPAELRALIRFIRKLRRERTSKSE